ncbi:zinc finger BED domain-containing protein RICESLEEPER 4-like [Solanum tuberosum]|uniref:zinc finger BED domain-containing protein RICESLEEPER 4-like n=1 Tax=Solanum tuberosum TaxID=4113 RepID=UPI00073A35DB|nr:PREDICTED: zinc finger BED domain-containing protein RICESLEEPER 4-like [Solanum tuberosum]
MEDDDECSAHETSVGVNESKESPQKKLRQLKSSVWRYFKKISRNKNEVKKAICRGCKEPYRQGNIQSRKIDQLISREKLVEAIIEHDLPLCISRIGNAIKEHFYCGCPESVFQRERKLKQVLAKIPNRVCLTSDCWTTGVELAATIYDCLKEWGIDRKVFSITLDNATNNDSMQTILKGHLGLQKSLLCDGEFFHVRCSAHILNLIVQEGLKAANDALFGIRESVKYVKGSDGRMRKFDQCVKQVGISTILGLRLDVTTRWNSTSSYPTSNLYFMQVWKIECLLKENSSNLDEVIKEMAVRMFNKFQKYWNRYSLVLSFGAILDPRFKMQLLEHCVSKVNSLAKAQAATIKLKLYKLYEQYANNQIGATAPTTWSKPIEEGSQSKQKKFTFFAEFKEFEGTLVCIAGKSELDLYLEEKKLDYQTFHEMDVIKYWKDNEKNIPIFR